MSKIINDRLTRSGIGCCIAVCPYGDSARQRVNLIILYSFCFLLLVNNIKRMETILLGRRFAQRPNENRRRRIGRNQQIWIDSTIVNHCRARRIVIESPCIIRRRSAAIIHVEPVKARIGGKQDCRGTVGSTPHIMQMVASGLSGCRRGYYQQNHRIRVFRQISCIASRKPVGSGHK